LFETTSTIIIITIWKDTNIKTVTTTSTIIIKREESKANNILRNSSSNNRQELYQFKMEIINGKEWKRNETKRTMSKMLTPNVNHNRKTNNRE